MTKSSDYDEWIQAFDGKVRNWYCSVQRRRRLQSVRRNGFERFIYADTFEEAVETVVQYAEPGDAVLLSPACASWDMFPSYEVRGRRFKELVNSL